MTTTTINIAKNLDATIIINEDQSIIVTTNYNGMIRRSYFTNVADLMDNSTIPAIKNYFVKN